MKPKRASKRWLEQAPEYILACYDYGEKTFDRYSILIGGNLWEECSQPYFVECLGMSDYPTHPQGFSQWGEAMRGPHLGKKVKWLDLPQNIREHTMARCS